MPDLEITPQILIFLVIEINGYQKYKKQTE